MPKRILSELKVLGSHIRYLPSLFLSSEDVAPQQSELNPSTYESVEDYLSVIRDVCVQKVPLSRGKCPKILRKTCKTEQVQIYFVNGICTNEATASVNAKRLSEVLNRSVNILHNPTEGILVDLYECLMGRSFGRISAPAAFGTEIVRADLAAGKKVILIGHSQGGIIISNIVRNLIDDTNVTDEHLYRLEAYTFASGARSHPNRKGLPYAEHFANEKDYVARIGVISHKSDIFGKMFLAKDRKGHLLNAHYLSGLANGHYGNRSRLFTYISQRSL